MQNLKLPVLLKCLPVLAGSLLLLGCGKGSPEDAGKKMADLECECANKRDELRYETKVKLKKELEDGKFTTRQQFFQRERELERPIHDQDSTCDAKKQAMEMQLALDFPKEDDRTTIRNTVRAHGEQCTQERQEATKSREEFNVYSLADKLPDGPPSTQ